MNLLEIINIDFISSIVLNILILFGLTLVNSFVYFRDKNKKILINIINGFIIGLIVFILMNNPWLSIPDKNTFFDVRTIVFVISTCYYGFTTTFIAAMIGIFYRVYLGIGTNNIIPTLVGSYSIIAAIGITYLLKTIAVKVLKKEECYKHYTKGLIVHLFVVIPYFFIDIYRDQLIIILIANLVIYPGIVYLLSVITENQLSRKTLMEQNLYKGSIIRGVLNSTNTVEIYALDKNYNYINFNNFHYNQMKDFYHKEIKIGTSIFDVIESIDMKERLKKYYDLSLLGEYNIIETEVEVNKDKFLQEHFSPIYNDYNEIVGITIFSQDITYIVEKEKEINHLIYYDSLTKVYNRRAFSETIEKFLEDDNHNFTVVYFDVNGLKTINDSIGHLGGDELLILVANSLHNDFKDYNSLVFRTGGDEFVVIIKNVTNKVASNLIDKTVKNISSKKVNGFPISISSGFAVKTINNNIKDVLKDAENKMYQNKIYEIASHRSKSILTILQTLKEKDFITESHSTNVSKISVKIGQTLNMSDLDISRLKLIARLHDIGKIGIDDNILNKKEKLTKEEFEDIKRHPAIGYRILSTIPEYLEIAHDVLHHHERYDGKGYPKGLKGEDIPIRSRIISVADAYDAMTSDRPYRKRMSKEKAIEEIKKNSGTQFDPKIVEAFIKSI